MSCFSKEKLKVFDPRALLFDRFGCAHVGGQDLFGERLFAVELHGRNLISGKLRKLIDRQAHTHAELGIILE